MAGIHYKTPDSARLVLGVTESTMRKLLTKVHRLLHCILYPEQE